MHRMGLEPILCINVCVPIHVMQFDADVDANAHANVTCKQSFTCEVAFGINQLLRAYSHCMCRQVNGRGPNFSLFRRTPWEINLIWQELAHAMMSLSTSSSLSDVIITLKDYKRRYYV